MQTPTLSKDKNENSLCAGNGKIVAVGSDDLSTYLVELLEP